MKLRLAALRAKATSTGRGHAYIEDVLAMATGVTGTHYELTDEAFARLRAKWGREAPNPTLADIVRRNAAIRAGCPSCRARHEAAMAARRSAT